MVGVDEADVDGATNAIAIAIFGTDCRKANSAMPIPVNEVRLCAQSWVQSIWRSWTYQVKKDGQKLQKVEKETNELRESMCTQNQKYHDGMLIPISEFETTHDLATFRLYLSKRSQLMDLYRLFGDEQCLNEIESHRQTLENIRQALAMDEKGQAQVDAPSM